jgi:hypothetical protein
LQDFATREKAAERAGFGNRETAQELGHDQGKIDGHSGHLAGA